MARAKSPRPTADRVDGSGTTWTSTPPGMVKLVGAKNPPTLSILNFVISRDVFRESMGCVLDLEKPTKTGSNFDVRIESVLLGDCVFIRTDTVGHSWSRTESKIARDGIDHFLIQFYLDGSKDLRSGDKGLVDRRSFMVIDTTQPYRSVTSEFANVTLVVPRRLLAPALRNPDGHATRVLSGREGLARVAYDAVHSLWRNTPQLSAEDASLALQPTLDLVAAALNGRPDDTRGKLAMEWMLRQKIRSHIEQNLHEPGLSPAALQRHFRLGRTKLYALFQDEGGIAQLIRNARLDRTLRMLVDPARAHLTVAEVAAGCGLCDPTGFGRVFKRRFGMTATDARQVGTPLITEQAGGHESEDRLWESWFRGL